VRIVNPGEIDALIALLCARRKRPARARGFLGEPRLMA